MFRLFVFLSALAIATPVLAQTGQQRACSTRVDLLKRLGQVYSEDPVALGIATNGGMLEVLSTQNGSTWTIIITMPDGNSCMFASGESWQAIPRKSQNAPT
ncbi:MAG: hypothetical protein ACTSX7_16480 [Alphaproteobacteria bacterium]